MPGVGERLLGKGGSVDRSLLVSWGTQLAHLKESAWGYNQIDLDDPVAHILVHHLHWMLLLLLLLVGPYL